MKAIKVYFSFIKTSSSFEFLLKKLFLIAFILSCPSLLWASDLSLKDVKNRLIGQEVVFLKDDNDLWFPVSGDEVSGYKLSYRNRYSLNQRRDMAGEYAVIVSIEKTASDSNTKKSNINDKDVFGDVIDDSRIMNPQIVVFFKLKESDQLVGTIGSYS